VANRVNNLREFAAEHDVVLFVAGKKSSNGKILFNQCLEVNRHTYLIANASELEKAWLDGKETIGICGATSTPRWLMERVAHRAAELIDETK
jgi:4-hydroxy-3-methylbut-2-enyl diphosphate reductase